MIAEDRKQRTEISSKETISRRDAKKTKEEICNLCALCVFARE